MSNITSTFKLNHTLLETIFTAGDKDCIYFSFFDQRKKKDEIKNVAE